MLVSVVIRTLNEAKYLPDLLKAVGEQDANGPDTEVVLVDSGSTDGTLEIARKWDCKLVHISREEFSFGRSLNIGCEAARGEVVSFISGHCVPVNGSWVRELVRPIASGEAIYSYGRQFGGAETRFSESQIFAKYFPAVSRIPQEGFFCNNANSALSTAVWRNNPFDEQLTGLEDLDLAKRLVNQGERIAYVAEAEVYHNHDETWRKVMTRFERESIALQSIMPEVHLSFIDFVRYLTSGVLLDSGAALQERQFLRCFPGILMYRLMQYWGSYRGNHEHRQMSRERKEKFFYPR